MREWLIKKLVGNKPIIANVTIHGVTGIKASEPGVIFHNALINTDEGGEKEKTSA